MAAESDMFLLESLDSCGERGREFVRERGGLLAMGGGCAQRLKESPDLCTCIDVLAARCWGDLLALEGAEEGVAECGFPKECSGRTA